MKSRSRKPRRSYDERKRDLTARYSESPKGRDLKWAILNCYFRASLTHADCAEILNCSISDIEAGIDIILQDAR